MSVPEKITRSLRYHESENRNKPWMTLFGFVWKTAGVCALICLIGIHFIYVHDYINQTSYFTTEEIEIKGNEHLKAQEILDYGMIKKGTNLFSINTFILEKRLENHPWIREASVKRDLPGKLIIDLVEFKEAAVIALGNNYLIDKKGEPFKRFDKKENLKVPLVKGLSRDDLLLGESRLFKSVVDILNIMDRESINTYGLKEIQADSELGLTIISSKVKSMKMCFDDFLNKFERAGKIISFMNSREKKINSMDLCNINRIVVKQELPAEK